MSERARFPKAEGLRESEDILRGQFPRWGNWPSRSKTVQTPLVALYSMEFYFLLNRFSSSPIVMSIMVGLPCGQVNGSEHLPS